ncbi:MAG: AAA family ATPase [Deltaproteobacteria bacterium]|nr:AAA family ATPase [Deltaproteobacteria bacterium]
MSQLSLELEQALQKMQQWVALEIEECRERGRDERKGLSDKMLEAKGLLLKGAVLVDEDPALFGRSRCTFHEGKNRLGQLSTFSVRPGAMVQMRTSEGEPGPSGVVIVKTHRFMKVVFDEVPDEVDADSVSLVRLEDEVTLERMSEAIRKAKAAEKETHALLEVVLGVRPSKPSLSLEHPSLAKEKWRFLDDNLNEDQRIAVQKAVFAQDVALIHGPPGTGKTRAVVEVVRQLLLRGQRVLCLCASNAAVDHVAIGVLDKDSGISLARAGHPARVNALLEQHTLSGLTDDHSLRKLSKKLVEDAFSLLRSVRKRSDRSGDARQNRKDAKREAGKLFSDARRLERQAVAEVLRKTQVLFGTLTGFQRELPTDETFDVLVVDEASQALTPAVLMALSRVKRVVLAGDHKQLPPTVKSQKAMRAGLGTTCFDALMSAGNAETYSHMLRVQHRMHEMLMMFSSMEFYDDKLAAHNDVAEHTLADLDADPVDFPAEKVLDFIDTAGAGFAENAAHDSSSRFNDEEVTLIVRAVKALTTAGLALRHIGVVTPYSAQAALLSTRLTDEIQGGLEVDSVDGFQGREKEVMLMSCVRSNDQGEVGFLADERRLNVAFTRARRKLVVVGDSATLGSNALWAKWVDYAIATSSYRSCFELQA